MFRIHHDQDEPNAEGNGVKKHKAKEIPVFGRCCIGKYVIPLTHHS
ncbi:MAG TPA: hypothetical protein VK654_09355 [Nitrospirota bacterium]|nr:hypothetical protein [Nitrospirota bacterium]